MGHLDKGQDILVDAGHIGEALVQAVDDLGHRALAVDLLKNLPGG